MFSGGIEDDLDKCGSLEIVNLKQIFRNVENLGIISGVFWVEAVGSIRLNKKGTSHNDREIIHIAKVFLLLIYLCFNNSIQTSLEELYI